MDNRLVLPPNSILESYRIIRVVGSGGFGITYEAEDLGLRTSVALKEYYPTEFGDRDPRMSIRPKSERHKATFEWGRTSFLQEARMLARFSHPSIVRVTRVFEAHSTAYMVMSFERGQSFEAWLKGLGRPPTQEELDRIAAPLLDALEAMHAVDFLHRDIAPDNIIVRADGSPVLLDFGAARRAVGEMSRALTGIVKAGYSPQEQYATDSRLQGPWSDLYAFGGTLYRAVTGQPPEESTLRSMEDRMPPATRAAAGGYRRAFLAAIDACLKVRIADRPKSIAELRPMLLPADAPWSVPGARLAEATSRATGAQPVFMPQNPLSKHWVAVSAAALILVGGIYAGVQYSRWHAEERLAAERAERAAAAQKEQDERRAAQSREAQNQPKRGREQSNPEEPFAEYFKRTPQPDTRAALPPSPGPSPQARAPRAGAARGWLGIKMQSVVDLIADSFDASPHVGALVVAVTPGSPAQKADLRERDIILRFDGKDVRTMRDLPVAIAGTRIGKAVDIAVLRNGERITLRANVGRLAGEGEGPTSAR